MNPVLYAEDEPDDLFFMRLAWEQAGIVHPLVAVKDGQQAIDYLAGHGAFADRQKFPLPVLVLLDLKLPIQNDLDVLQWLRQQPALASLKVVVMSGSELETDLARARSLGVIDYIVKPASPARLAAIVLQRHSLWLGAG